MVGATLPDISHRLLWSLKVLECAAVVHSLPPFHFALMVLDAAANHLSAFFLAAQPYQRQGKLFIGTTDWLSAI